jgi:hypothetical protein
MALLSDGSKRCPACGETRPASGFYLIATFHHQNGDNYSGYCRDCQSCCVAKARARRAAWSAERRRVDQDRSNARRAARREADPLLVRKENLRRNFGLSHAEYDALLAGQAGVCAICHQFHANKGQTYLQVDHDHATGAIRGLLCGQCNKGLGNFSDDPTRLRAAIEYLARRQPQPQEDQ